MRRMLYVVVGDTGLAVHCTVIATPPKRKEKKMSGRLAHGWTSDRLIRYVAVVTMWRI